MTWMLTCDEDSIFLLGHSINPTVLRDAADGSVLNGGVDLVLLGAAVLLSSVLHLSFAVTSLTSLLFPVSLATVIKS